MKTAALLLSFSVCAIAGDLETFLDGKVHLTLRNEACQALSADRSPEVVKAMRASIGNTEVQACAGANLRKAGAIAELLSALTDSDAAVRAVAAREIGVMEKPEYLASLRTTADDADLLTASNAVEGLSRYRDHSSAPQLREIAQKNGIVSTLALNTLIDWHDTEVPVIGRRLMASDAPGDQLAGIRAIARTGNADDLGLLRELAKDEVNLAAGGRGFGLMPAVSISRAAASAIRDIEARRAAK